VGSRGSPLALRQTETAISLLEDRGAETELLIVKTKGDHVLDLPLHRVSGRGLFVREIDDLMLAGKIDVAVHSMKDLPSKRPEGLVIAAVLVRNSPFDVLVSDDGVSLEDLEEGAVVGTCSMRRASQLRRARPDLVIESLRGNLETRLRKLEEGKYRAIVLAEAGIERMGYCPRCSVLDPETFVPSANQGAIAVVAARGRAEEIVRKRGVWFRMTGVVPYNKITNIDIFLPSAIFKTIPLLHFYSPLVEICITVITVLSYYE